MLLALSLCIPVVPGLVWLYLIYRTDKYEPEPKRWVAMTFLIGVASIVPAFLVERLADAGYPYLAAVETAASAKLHDSVDPLRLAIACFCFIGPAEELFKFLAVRLVMYRHREFDEPIDGIVYSAAAALGFASLENIFYVVDFQHGFAIRWGLLGIRTFLALPGHVIFAAMWGSALGRQKFDPRYRVWPHLLLAAGLHGLYDLVLMYPPARAAIVLYMAILVPIVIRKIRLLQKDSPYAPENQGRGPAVVVSLTPTPRDGE